jgi:hypothetical protein
MGTNRTAAAAAALAAVFVAAELRRKWFVQSSQCTSDDMGTNRTAAAAAAAALAAVFVAAELRRKWFVQSSQCTSDDMGTNGSGQLHLTQAWSVFMIVASGAGVALLLAAGEMLYYRRLYTRECRGIRV